MILIKLWKQLAIAIRLWVRGKWIAHCDKSDQPITLSWDSSWEIARILMEAKEL